MKYKFYWLNPKLHVKKTVNCGLGTYAKEDIQKGEKVLVLSGYVMRLQDEAKLPGTLSDNGLQISEDFSLCVSKEEELGGINYFNHSCSPNVGINGQIFLVAMKKIKAGEEAVFDYAMTLCQSKNVEPYHMDCLCGKRNCRKVITDSDWEKPELQEKYDGYFQYFIQEKINKRNKTKKKK
jgi:SET domain-containing protein